MTKPLFAGDRSNQNLQKLRGQLAASAEAVAAANCQSD